VLKAKKDRKRRRIRSLKLEGRKGGRTQRAISEVPEINSLMSNSPLQGSKNTPPNGT